MSEQQHAAVECGQGEDAMIRVGRRSACGEVSRRLVEERSAAQSDEQKQEYNAQLCARIIKDRIRE